MLAACVRLNSSPLSAVHGVWEEWSPWSLCSFTCGRGHRTRTRMCTPPQHGGRACDGPETQSKLCNIALCPGASAKMILLQFSSLNPASPPGFFLAALQPNRNQFCCKLKTTPLIWMRLRGTVLREWFGGIRPDTEAPQCLIPSIKNQSSSRIEVALGSTQQLPVVKHYRINYRIVYCVAQIGNGYAREASWRVESNHVPCAIEPEPKGTASDSTHHGLSEFTNTLWMIGTLAMISCLYAENVSLSNRLYNLG